MDLPTRVNRLLQECEHDTTLREQLLNNPKQALADAGIVIANDTNIIVEDNTATGYGIFLGFCPKNSQETKPSTPDHYMDCHRY